MIIAFSVVAGLAALVLLFAGLMKLVRPKPALHSAGMAWVEDFPAPAVKLIGIAEILGALGLVLPVLTGIAPIFSPIAGICLAVIMIGAAVVHIRRKESPAAAIAFAVLAIAAGVLGCFVVL